MALVRDYFNKTKELREKYGENTLVLMQVGKFFEVYGKYDSKNDTYYDSNIYDFSIKCDCRISNKGSNIKMAGIPEQSLEKYIEKLQKFGYTLAIYTQDKNEKNTTRSLSMICSPGTYFHNNNDVLSNNICVINIYNRPPSFLNTKAQIHIGLSCIDIISGLTNYFQHQEEYYHNPSTYDVIEKYISIYKPSEVLFLYDREKLSEAKVDDIIDFTGMVQSIVKKIDLSIATSHQEAKDVEAKQYLSKMANNCGKQNYQYNIIENYYKPNDIHAFMETHKLFENDIGCQSFCFLLDYIYSHNKRLIEDLSEPKIENLEGSLYLGNHSLKQLNIITSNEVSGKLSSVLSFLNNCVTPMGKRYFKNQLLHPITNNEILTKKYDFVEAFTQFTERNTIKSHLQGMCDFQKLIRKIILQKTSLNDIYDFYVSLNKCDLVLKELKKNGEQIESHYHESYVKIGKKIKGIVDFMKKKIDFKILREKTKANYIKQCVFSDLDLCEKEYFESYDKFLSIQSFFSQLISYYSKQNTKDGCKVHKPERTEYYLKTTKTRSSLIQKNIDKYIKYHREKYKSDYEYFSKTHSDESLKPNSVLLIYNSTYSKENHYFIFDTNVEFHPATKTEMKIYSNDISKLATTNLKNESILNILIHDKTLQIVKELYGYKTSILAVSEFITLTDVMCQNATNAVKYKYCKPKIFCEEKSSKKKTKTKRKEFPKNKKSKNELCNIQNSFLRAKNMRHVLIEQLNSQECYVPNDIYFDDSQKGILLFGTNAVGKSSLIKSIGISVIMAQAGCFVPCDIFEFKPYTSIYTRILGNDNIFKGLSTFAVEMTELNSILHNANENSLILGDELCSGTEMGSAISIFTAGLQYLNKVKSSYIFATHFHEIVKFDEIKDMKTLALKHMSVVYDKEKDCLIYNRKLLNGPGTNNYGLEVCKSLNLPESFITDATAIKMKYISDDNGVSIMGESKYNKEKVKKQKCELCKERKAVHIHHMKYQQTADQNNMIGHFHKNHNANLVSICEPCHESIHKKNEVLVKKKTSNGYMYMEENE